MISGQGIVYKDINMLNAPQSLVDSCFEALYKTATVCIFNNIKVEQMEEALKEQLLSRLPEFFKENIENEDSKSVVDKLVDAIKSEILSNIWESLEGETDLEKILYYTYKVL